MSQTAWVNTKNIDWDKIGVIIAYSISTLLILFVYYSNRSLFLDGLNLARNVAESSFTELMQPLKYEQSAPILFLFLSKISTLFFGVSEYSLRLLPLISGLACLYFFKDITDKLMSSKYVILGVFWLGTHAMFIRYATEFKQYMTDAFVTVFLIWLALRVNNLSKRNIFILGLAGAIGIWLSMPSIFVLFGLIGYYIHKQHLSHGSQFPILLLTIWFALHFALEYALVLSPAIRSEHMQNFHQNYFIQGEFWKLNSLQHDFGLVISMIRMAVGKSGLGIVTALVLIVISIYDFIRNKKSVGLLITLPIIAVFGASLLGKYSLIERLMLFTLPLLFVLLLFGIQIVVNSLKDKNPILNYSIIGLIGLSLLVGYSQTQGFKYITSPLEIEDNKSALIYISEHEKHTNTIICTQLAHPAYAYYSNYDKNFKGTNIGKAVAAKYDDSVIELAINQAQKDKTDVWILMGHMLDHDITQLISELDKVGTIKNSYRTNRSAAILFSTQ